MKHRYKGVAEKVNGFGQDEVFGMDRSVKKGWRCFRGGRHRVPALWDRALVAPGTPRFLRSSGFPARRPQSPACRGCWDGHDMHVAAARETVDFELLEQGLELLLVRVCDADEEQDAAAAACPASREEEQSLMAAATPEITVQDRLPVCDCSPHGVGAGDLGCRHGSPSDPDVGVPEPSHVGFELVAQVRARRRFGHGSRTRTAETLRHRRLLPERGDQKNPSVCESGCSVGALAGCVGQHIIPWMARFGKVRT